MVWFYHYSQVYKQIPMKCATVLPDEGFGNRYIRLSDTPGFSFYVYCKPKGKGSHRLFVKCDCGRDIPFGRMGQHWNTHKRGKP
jgi:hypothetical protein